jgi:hypothetical protein
MSELYYQQYSERVAQVLTTQIANCGSCVYFFIHITKAGLAIKIEE